MSQFEANSKKFLFVPVKRKQVKFKRILSIFYLIANINDIIVISLSVLCTYICKEYGFVGDLPLSFIFTAIIFPIVFSINSAYMRREEALRSLGNIKAHSVALYMAFRNWAIQEPKPNKLHLRNLLLSFYKDMSEHFLKYSQKKETSDYSIYDKFNKISLSIQDLRANNITASELSRLDQYLSKIMQDYERLRSILIYRTPYILRTFTLFFNYSFPIFCAPYFAYYVSKYSNESYYQLYYLLPILYSCILVSLSNIQDQLENPFDQDSDEDVQMDEQELIDSLQAIENDKITYERI
jgi:hypothetical protein